MESSDPSKGSSNSTVHFRTLQSGASDRSLGFEDEDLRSSSKLVGRYSSYLLPKQTRGTTQILIFKTLRMIGRLALHKIYTVSKGAPKMDKNVVSG